MLNFLRKKPKEEPQLEEEIDSEEILDEEEEAIDIERVLIWIDKDHSDLISRILRGVAIAEAYVLLGSNHVVLACPYIPLVDIVVKESGIQYIQTNSVEGNIHLKESIIKLKPEIVIKG
mgnify:CR=1 FL=1